MFGKKKKNLNEGNSSPSIQFHLTSAVSHPYNFQLSKMKLQGKLSCCDSVPGKYKRSASLFLHQNALHSDFFLPPLYRPGLLFNPGVSSADRNTAIWHQPLEYTLLVSSYRSVCTDGRKGACSARACTVTGCEHSRYSGVSTPKQHEPIQTSSCRKHFIPEETGHLRIQVAKSTHGQINSFWMCNGRMGKCPKNQEQQFSGRNNSVISGFRLPHRSPCECSQWLRPET